MKRFSPNWLLAISAAFTLALDQFTKYLIRKYMAPREVIEVIPGFFDLINIRNRGAAFGFLNRSDMEWQFWLFLGATAVAIVAIFLLARDAHKPMLKIALGLILGGALGNLVDRLRFRAVVDFMDFYWHDWHWPAFNVADMGICIGAFLACIALWRKEQSA